MLTVWLIMNGVVPKVDGALVAAQTMAIQTHDIVDDLWVNSPGLLLCVDLIVGGFSTHAEDVNRDLADLFDDLIDRDLEGEQHWDQLYQLEQIRVFETEFTRAHLCHADVGGEHFVPEDTRAFDAEIN